MATSQRRPLKAVIVTGSRKWRNPRLVWQAIEASGATVIVHGDCQSGADAHAAGYAGSNRLTIAEVPMPAQWQDEGRAAGPLRNGRMLSLVQNLAACNYIVEVLAFPMSDGKGTQDCMRAARAAHITVKDFNEEYRYG